VQEQYPGTDPMGAVVNDVSVHGSAVPLGPFTGRGPRDYQRADESIREDIGERLARDPELDPSEAEVMVTRGEVLLTGTVNSRADKRKIEDVAWQVSGVRDVQNRLRVGTVIHAPRIDVTAEEFDMPWPKRDERR
jgi:osmotically-inducible protein OsmY